MKRLIEKIVFSGFVIACRLATWPTRISPSFVKAATEGVRRLPSWFAITVGLPPSTIATTELVVPRSIPITFAMVWSPCGVDARRRGPTPGPLRHFRTGLQNVDLDFLRLGLFGLREPHLEHSVAIGRLRTVGLDGHR